MNIPSYLIEDSGEINKAWIGDEIVKVGLTSGASVPDILVRETVERLKKEFGFDRVVDIQLVKEHVNFQLPKKLKEKIAS